jgi:hypothetical protein
MDLRLLRRGRCAWIRLSASWHSLQRASISSEQRSSANCPRLGVPSRSLSTSGYLYVMYPSASDAQDVVMRLHVAVIARNVVQECYLARLSDIAELLENPMHRGQ